MSIVNHQQTTGRWKVTLIYRSEHGQLDIEHFVEELSEIEEIVELGPDWNTLIEGHFSLIRRSGPLDLTVEGSRNR